MQPRMIGLGRLVGNGLKREGHIERAGTTVPSVTVRNGCPSTGDS
jgi:hypothetical protein